MELSNLLDKVTNKKELHKKFLAIELTDDIVQAAVWQVVDSITEVVSVGTPVPWNGDEGNLEELITAVDTTITKAIEQLDHSPTEVIFGIPNTWIKNDSLVQEKRTYLKKISQDLELTPLGYVIVMDSLIRYLRMQEGTPASAILIQVADTELTLAVVIQGKTQALKTISRGDDVAADVESTILNCAQDFKQLPSRFLVFDGMHDLEEVVQNLTLVDWVAKFPFLHIPKIEALNKDIVIRALCVAGGAEVAKSIGITITDQPVKPENIENQAEDFEALGFQQEELKDLETTNSSLPKPKIPHITLPHLPLRTLLALFVVAFVFFIFAGSLWLFPKAVVTLTLEPKQESTKFIITMDPSTSAVIDAEKLIIPVSTVTTTVQKEGTIPTTGSKEVGEPAKGEVTIYNRTLVKKTFPQGTTLSASGLKFTLDSEVSVASKSVGVDYVDVPGKETVKITASAIGEKSNLPSGTEFTIGAFATESFIAKNDSALKGGTSRAVAAVSAKDKTNLINELKSQLELEAQQKLQEQGDLIYLLPNATKITFENYSNKVGEEAETLSATISITVSGYELSRATLTSLGKQKISQTLIDSQLIGEPQVKIGEGDAEKTTVEVAALTLPQLDISQLQNNLRGVRGEAAFNQVVGTIPGLKSATLAISPSWIPKFMKSLPRKAENIEIKIVSTSQ